MKYRNPILMGDYSDPDVIRVGKNFYMISSSFTYLPGIPVLRSEDLVHWELIGYAAERLPFDRYRKPVHRCGTWAPSIRYHQGTFYIYVCLPDEGLFAYTADDPAGPWECHWVKDVSGWIDPCPLFDDDGRTWLVHGFAASRCGINNLLYVHEMSPDGLKVLDKGVLVYNGADHGDITVEGPKLYKREGTYWILCPAGGVATGYQLAMRSDAVTGPYEPKTVLRQGKTEINGPHQGGWFDDGEGRDWFIHFQDVGVYGRVPHLQPVDWSSGWPIMGNGGEPVSEGDTGLPERPAGLKTTDRFETGMGRQWQWQANPDPAWIRELKPGIRLQAAPARSMYEAGQFLSQLMQAYNFDMEVLWRLNLQDGDAAGIGIMGYPYHCMTVENGRIRILRGEITEYARFIPETVREIPLAETEWTGTCLRMRLRVRQGRMSFALEDGSGTWRELGESYSMAAGGWTSARPGIFCLNRRGQFGGWADAEYVLFRDEEGNEMA
ncbi:MAG: family 43 glycosylhydrolase [Clostridia bacterium]|nr:family 43 glycosylhydrolase [Clostridia bacterium]